VNATHARVILIDPSEQERRILTRRLSAQGYTVDETPSPITGAEMALAEPPAAVIADLWMPGISGVQLCRLLRSEPATADVPLILRGDGDGPRERFWAERAGANSFVPKGRMGELVRALAASVKDRSSDDTFFFQVGAGSIDIRDRIARHLDDALFDSVIAADVRALASAGSFERLFDMMSQLLSQLSKYRWLALSTVKPARLAIHHRPADADRCEAEARAALEIPDRTVALRVEDQDAAGDQGGPPAIVHDIVFGGSVVGRIAVAPAASAKEEQERLLISLVARELGGPIRMATLVEDSQRLAATDALTGLMNRRAFTVEMDRELARCDRYGDPMALALLDVDHFKVINDQRGHAAGDQVLAGLGNFLRKRLRLSDLSARWGGEEFMVVFANTDLPGAVIVAERMRQGIESLLVGPTDRPIPITASVGLALRKPGERLESVVDRADRAMYASKTSGRNRLTIARDEAEPSHDMTGQGMTSH
jgi:two-component system cell cycle response regulator